MRYSNSLLTFLVKKLQKVVDNLDYSKIPLREDLKFALFNANAEEKERIYRIILSDLEEGLQKYFSALKKVNAIAFLLDKDDSKALAISVSQLTNTLVQNIIYETNTRYNQIQKNCDSIYVQGEINE